MESATPQIETPPIENIPRNKSMILSHLSRGYELIFKNICVKVDKKEILSDVNGLVKPGEMVAIMGPSGAGKSTLLNAIAGRLSLDGGSVTLNSRVLDKQLRRKISYVLQDDTFLTRLTFWDTIWYTALLRLPDSMPTKEKKRRVDEIIDALDMRKCLNTIIGDPTNRGLSGGEKKRANIACELLTNPALMLLDEPTSGLDSATAFSLMSTLKKFAHKSGKTVVATIHQPSSQIFNMFDRLLLLCDGKVAYYGGVENCAQHFASIGLVCAPHYNLADFILDSVKEVEPETKAKIIERAMKQRFEDDYPWQLKPAGKKPQSEANNNEGGFPPPPYSEQDSLEKGLRKAKKGEVNGAFDASTESVNVRFSEIDAEYEEDLDMIKYRKEYEAKWPTGFWTQYTVLTRRSFKQALPRILSKPNLIQCVVVATFVGMLWFQTKPEESFLDDRMGVIFFQIVYQGFSPLVGAVTQYIFLVPEERYSLNILRQCSYANGMGYLAIFFIGNRNNMISQMLGVQSIPLERPVLNKERLAGYYRLSAYYLAKTTSELPLVLMIPTIFFTIVYWLAGLNNDFLVYLQLLGTLLLSSVTAQGIGLFFGALILDFTVAFLTSTTTMLCVMLAGGFYVQNIPVWASWLQYLSFVQYTYYSALTIDITNIQIKCATNGSRFCPPNLNSSEINYIPQQALLDFYTSASDGWVLWHYIACTALIIIAMRSLTYFVLRTIRKPPSAKN